MEKIEINQLQNISASMDRFGGGKDYIDITAWANGEGWDITIGERQFRLHYSELEAINYLTKHLEYADR